MSLRRVRASLIVTALALAACSESPAAADLPPVADPLFEVEFHSPAATPAWNGYYVDKEGHVVSYDLAADGYSALGDSVLTADQLAARYDHVRKLVKTLPAGDVSAKYQLVAQAAPGAYTDRRVVCLDSGAESYSAWIYSTADGKYHRLLLHLRGYQAQANTSAAAATLFHWLEDVTGTRDPSGSCDPFA